MFKVMRKISRLILILTVILSACSSEKGTIINSSNPNIEYWGRIDTSKLEGAGLYWSGTSIKVNFEGESVQALLKDESGDNYYNIIIDNDSISILFGNGMKNIVFLICYETPNPEAVGG